MKIILILSVMLVACVSTPEVEDTATNLPAPMEDAAPVQPTQAKDVFSAATGGTGYKNGKGTGGGQVATTGRLGSKANPVSRNQPLTLQYTSKGFSRGSIFATTGARLTVVNRIPGQGPTARFCGGRVGSIVCDPRKTEVWKRVGYRQSHKMAFNLRGKDPGEFFISGRPNSGGRHNHKLTIHVLAQDVKIVKPAPLSPAKPPVPKPTPIEIVIQESIAVGSPSGGGEETSTKGSLAPLSETIGVVDTSSTDGTVAPMSEAIAVKDETVVEPGALPTPTSQQSVETKKYK